MILSFKRFIFSCFYIEKTLKLAFDGKFKHFILK